MRDLLVMHVVDTVAPIGHGPAIHRHPTTDILAAFPANRHHAPVAVPVSLLTKDRRTPDHITEFQGCALAAVPVSSRCVDADLPALGGIDAEHAR